MFLAESTTNREKRRRMLSSHSYLAVRFYERLSLIFDRENGTPPVSTVTPTETVWVNENGTRVRTHSERRLAESLQLLPSILVDCDEHLRYFENLLDLRIVGAAQFQAPRPIHSGSSCPVIGRPAEKNARGSTKSFGGKI
jgi:hypothetical protein